MTSCEITWDKMYRLEGPSVFPASALRSIESLLQYIARKKWTYEILKDIVFRPIPVNKIHLHCSFRFVPRPGLLRWLQEAEVWNERPGRSVFNPRSAWKKVTLARFGGTVWLDAWIKTSSGSLYLHYFSNPVSIIRTCYGSWCILYNPLAVAHQFCVSRCIS